MWGGVTPHWVIAKLSTIVHFDFFLNVGKLPRNNASYVMTSALNSIKKSNFYARLCNIAILIWGLILLQLSSSDPT